jgi:predicted NUDIX family phosphoesterase
MSTNTATETTASASTSAQPVESIAYVPREALARRGWLEQGFRPDVDTTLYETLREQVRFGPRPALERDPNRKQLIPYVVLTDGSRIFTMQRKRAQTEARLHDRLSFGVGGHIDRVDDRADDVIQRGLMRELEEELVLDGIELELEYRGTLNDDSNEVGQVHLGLIYTCHVAPDADVAIRETEKMEGRWWELDDLAREAGRLESWSRMLLPSLPDWLE